MIDRELRYFLDRATPADKRAFCLYLMYLHCRDALMAFAIAIAAACLLGLIAPAWLFLSLQLAAVRIWPDLLTPVFDLGGDLWAYLDDKR